MAVAKAAQAAASAVHGAMNTSGRLYVAMSGGVDSSTVAAMLSRKFGKSKVRGVYMRNWSLPNSRCHERDWATVQKVCADCGIDSVRVELDKEYWHTVFEPMLAAYERGETPNPDVSCNRQIKFGALVSKLRQLDPAFETLATGHYAGIDPETGLVRRALHRGKDQSYYLATVERDVLKHVMLPLADFRKPDVRQMCLQYGLSEKIARKPDSQGLCFVEQQEQPGKRRFSNFLADFLEPNEGPIVLANDLDKVVGTHNGLWTHTIGQRASVSLPQHIPEYRGQWFVVRKDADQNALVIDRGRDSKWLHANTVVTENFKWHCKPPEGRLQAQFRSLQEPWDIASFDDNVFRFTEKRTSVAPGQYLVVYANDVVVGAGVIKETYLKE